MGYTDVVHRSVEQVLADCRALTLPSLRLAVSALPGSSRTVADYHFGGSGAGKMIRPTLTLLSAQAVGGHVEDAVPAAVAVELIHNFTLLHDDVMDGDRTRHHRATVWAAYGTTAAVLAGDALWALALRVLRECDRPLADAGIRVLSVALDRVVAGQTADIDFELRTEVSVAECLDMVAGKTGALLAASCALGALFGGGSIGQQERLASFGSRIGLAFQLLDDLLGIWGDPAVTGKPVGADLSRRKKTLPVVAALTSGTPAGDELDRLYRMDRALSGADLERAATLVEEAGGRVWARREAEQRFAEAQSLLCSADLAPTFVGELTELARMIVSRDR